MFGLEDQKKKKPTQEFIFELEKDLKDPKKHKMLRSKLKGASKKLKRCFAQVMTRKSLIVSVYCCMVITPF